MHSGPRVLVITGPGKGKTTAACGVILRSAAHGKKTLLTRFAKTTRSGELSIIEKLPEVVIFQGDRGMTPPPTHPDYPLHVAAARKLFDETKARADEFDTIVMDEICGITSRGMIGEGEVVDFLRSLRPEQTVVLTGRGAGVELIAAADTVSEIQCLKHGYMRGLPAQEGVEM